MCFGGMTTVECCERCDRHHPPGLENRCNEITAAIAADTLDEELHAYLESREAAFFSWLAAHT